MHIKNLNTLKENTLSQLLLEKRIQTSVKGKVIYSRRTRDILPASAYAKLQKIKLENKKKIKNVKLALYSQLLQIDLHINAKILNKSDHEDFVNVFSKNQEFEKTGDAITVKLTDGSLIEVPLYYRIQKDSIIYNKKKYVNGEIINIDDPKKEAVKPNVKTKKEVDELKSPEFPEFEKMPDIKDKYKNNPIVKLLKFQIDIRNKVRTKLYDTKTKKYFDGLKQKQIKKIINMLPQEVEYDEQESIKKYPSKEGIVVKTITKDYLHSQVLYEYFKKLRQSPEKIENYMGVLLEINEDNLYDPRLHISWTPGTTKENGIVFKSKEAKKIDDNSTAGFLSIVSRKYNELTSTSQLPYSLSVDIKALITEYELAAHTLRRKLNPALYSHYELSIDHTLCRNILKTSKNFPGLTKEQKNELVESLLKTKCADSVTPVSPIDYVIVYYDLIINFKYKASQRAITLFQTLPVGSRDTKPLLNRNEVEDLTDKLVVAINSNREKAIPISSFNKELESKSRDNLMHPKLREQIKERVLSRLLLESLIKTKVDNKEVIARSSKDFILGNTKKSLEKLETNEARRLISNLIVIDLYFNAKFLKISDNNKFKNIFSDNQNLVKSGNYVKIELGDKSSTINVSIATKYDVNNFNDRNIVSVLEKYNKPINKAKTINQASVNNSASKQENGREISRDDIELRKTFESKTNNADADAIYHYLNSLNINYKDKGTNNHFSGKVISLIIEKGLGKDYIGWQGWKFNKTSSGESYMDNSVTGKKFEWCGAFAALLLKNEVPASTRKIFRSATALKNAFINDTSICVYKKSDYTNKGVPNGTIKKGDVIVVQTSIGQHICYVKNVSVTNNLITSVTTYEGNVNVNGKNTVGSKNRNIRKINFAYRFSNKKVIEKHRIVNKYLPNLKSNDYSYLYSIIFARYKSKNADNIILSKISKKNMSNSYKKTKNKKKAIQSIITQLIKYLQE